MRDDRIEKLAAILVDYSASVSTGDKVAIRGAHVAEPLMLALYRRCLDKGAYVRLETSLTGALPLFYKHASDDQLQYVWPVDEWMIENVDVMFHILADTNTRQLSGIDPSRQAMASKAREGLMRTSMQRAADGEYRWNVTLFPTQAYAMEAGMSLDEYEEFYFRACLVGEEDPVAEWRKMAERNHALVEWMQGRKQVHIEGEGTDLTLGIEERTFIPSEGKENFPDGEIFTGPVEDQTNGVVTFTYPAIYGGRAVEGVRLEFENGRIVHASAQRNEDFLIKTLDIDSGARVLGELGIGTNHGIDRFTGEVLLDEKIGGTIHLAVGRSYPETGGLNESAVHWDMVCDLRRGGRVTVDGDIFMEDGKIVV